MSWKLAELRWRQEAGLQGNVRSYKQQEKSSEIWSPRYRDSIQMIETADLTPAAVWSQHAWEDARSVRYVRNPNFTMPLGLSGQIVPDLDVSESISPHVSVSSSTPLLKGPRTRSTISFEYVGRSQSNGQESKLPIFPNRKEPCTHSSKAQTPLSPVIPAIDQIPHSMTMSSCHSSELEGPVLMAMSNHEQSKASTHQFHIPESQIRFTNASPINSSLYAGANHNHTISSEQHPQQGKCHSFNQAATSTDDQVVGIDRHSSNAALSEALCESYKDNVDLLRKNGPQHSDICTTMPTADGFSIESRHSATPDVFDKTCSGYPRFTTASQRRATLQLSPDLPSPHADILGHRYKTNFGESLSERDLRFPLICSVSSEEEDERENSAHPSLPDTWIPLQDLPRREVLSAHGILHEAKYHQESSAVFETSEIPEETVLSERESTTLDEIVSQYADYDPSRSPSYPQNEYREALKEIEDGKKSPMHGTSGCAITEHRDLECRLDRMGAQLNTPEQLLDNRDIRHIRAGSLRSTAIISPNLDVESDGSDGGWQETPHSSRCGFLTPSKMRFRLAKRDSAEATCTDGITESKPMSPWDPFARSLSSKRRRERVNKLRLSHRIQAHPAMIGLQRHHPPSRPSHVRSPKMQDDSSRLTRSRSLDVNLSHVTQVAVNIPPLGNIYSDYFLVETPTRALPSSSLFPSLTGRNWKLHNLSHSGIEHPGDESQASRRDPFVQFEPSSFEHQEKETSSSELQVLGGTAGGRPAGSIVATTAEGHRMGKSPRNEPSKSSGSPLLLGHQISPGASLGPLWQSQYDNSDAAISRFLRGSRYGENVTLIRAPRPQFRRGESDLGIRAAGSSLADISSSSTSLGLKRPSNKGLGSESLDHWQSARFGDEDLQRLSFAGPAPSGTNGKSASYRAFNRVESGEATLTSSSSTSACLLSRHESHGNEPVIRLPLANQCPAFPLTAEQLATRSDINCSVPFERLQMLRNGKWLERGWCLVHQRNEFSHASLTAKKGQDDTGAGLEQRRLAGRLLLALGVATYFVGGFALIHDMARQGVASQLAMGHVMRGFSLQEGCDADLAVGGLTILSREADMAQVVERACFVAAVLVLAACFTVCVWAATAL
ncbi:uncharacterized protein A1O9_10613 [Exophiala aquamarina CBS 119918]|uniref:Uncharacterized protein n=1 Tax=Exophiala aquamarina CBS 119918 TaxID=1182545 RepID=A0A072PC62_9EURO|nr:uncharacterized protein A1O9_10613 [Exophiala aquamarina CBS 119918]KEF53165.1 hypothetical protein A1O9_10613 [Exophiala aquamarina CBS 119918]